MESSENMNQKAIMASNEIFEQSDHEEEKVPNIDSKRLQDCAKVYKKHTDNFFNIIDGDSVSV